MTNTGQLLYTLTSTNLCQLSISQGRYTAKAVLSVARHRGTVCYLCCDRRTLQSFNYRETWLGSLIGSFQNEQRMISNYSLDKVQKQHKKKIAKYRCRLELRHHFFSARVVNWWLPVTEYAFDRSNSFKKIDYCTNRKPVYYYYYYYY